MKDLLPVGSVVMLEGGSKKTVIMGILQFDLEKQDKIYDYLGVPYPEGYLGKGSCYFFNHDSVVEVLFRGYENEERLNMLKILNQIQQGAEIVLKKENMLGETVTK